MFSLPVLVQEQFLVWLPEFSVTIFFTIESKMFVFKFMINSICECYKLLFQNLTH